MSITVAGFQPRRVSRRGVRTLPLGDLTIGESVVAPNIQIAVAPVSGRGPGPEAHEEPILRALAHLLALNLGAEVLE
jgi:hypothetical protein